MITFLSGISLTCFAASYGIAWLLEAAKLALRPAAKQFWVLLFVLAGFLAHTLYLVFRARELASAPLSSSFDWCLVAAWLLVVAFLYLSYYHPQTALGLYMLPLALALLAAAHFADPTPVAADPAAKVWGIIHGVALLFGTLAVTVGFVAGVMYLSQAHRLKLKLPPSPRFRAPSLEWLEKINSRAILFSALMVAIGFVAGIILNIIGRKGQGNLPWSDPVIWSSGLMLAWLMAAAIFNAVYRPARRGRKVAYLTVVSFLFLVAAIGVLVLVNTEHGKPKEEVAASGERKLPVFVEVAGEKPKTGSLRSPLAGGPP